MDNDLVESIAALKAALEAAEYEGRFAKSNSQIVEALRDRYSLPRRYVEFLLDNDPQDIEVRSPAESVQLISSESLAEEQSEYSEQGGSKNGWRPSWFVIAHSGLLGDPYFLDTSQPDAEGDCPVYTAMSGTDSWQPRLCATSFALFLRILAITLEVAEDFDLDDYDPDNERVFREAVGPRIREVDPAAVKAGHWT